MSTCQCQCQCINTNMIAQPAWPYKLPIGGGSLIRLSIHTLMCPVHTFPSRSIASDVTRRCGLSIPNAVVDCPASEKNSSMLPGGARQVKKKCETTTGEGTGPANHLVDRSSPSSFPSS